ncbi:hypothetical protein [Dictyobacter arantiisoli]|uniref:Uncharacterized protein n=1 Tax=Dictyobacter arantiisoli TaxID=2014874 RepID=A0A5A5TH72_9CHLR|nr:hypothetical protein [Dictyobacter arantiisoli]GCF10717.1 hypothetical protein KDI_42810 [Dictyobacter arantiisoli]
MVTDEDDFEQTEANKREYRMYKSARRKKAVPIYGGYAGSGFYAILAIFNFGGPDFGAYILSALMLYWVIFLFSLLYKTEETFLLKRLHRRGNPKSPGTAWRKWFLFFRRGLIIGLVYTFLMFIVWQLKL